MSELDSNEKAMGGTPLQALREVVMDYVQYRKNRHALVTTGRFLFCYTFHIRPIIETRGCILVTHGLRFLCTGPDIREVFLDQVQVPSVVELGKVTSRNFSRPHSAGVSVPTREHFILPKQNAARNPAVESKENTVSPGSDRQGRDNDVHADALAREASPP